MGIDSFKTLSIIDFYGQFRGYTAVHFTLQPVPAEAALKRDAAASTLDGGVLVWTCFVSVF